MSSDDSRRSAPGSRPGASASPADAGSVHVLVESGRVRVVLSGEIDASVADDLDTAAGDAMVAGRPTVEVDCRNVSFMDSTGIGFVARLAARSASHVVLLNPAPVVSFLLETVKISHLVTVVQE